MGNPILDPVLDIPGVLEALQMAGYKVKLRSVQRLASERKLPFKRGPDNKTLYIKESELKAAVDRGLFD